MKRLFACLALSAGLLCAAAASAQVVLLKTSVGDIRVALDAQNAPKTTANFLQYVKAGQYDGEIFHRVIGSFMIQTGGYTADLKPKPVRASIPLESRNGLLNLRGSIAMARTNDPNSATSQFFINVVDNPMLDAANSQDGNGYAVFGQVIAGMDVVDKIRAVQTHSVSVFQNLPLTPITILKASVEKQR
ncbi:MAG: peptidylprolyl isomerase [Paucibacter sp.]|nr:peptidylprolyl isomerase [Roseateles sp.]